MSSTYSIPVLDLDHFTRGTSEQRQNFIQELGTALREIGFFALTNHAIDNELIKEGYKQVAALFELPEASKSSYEIRGLQGQRGYTAFGKEHAKDSPAPDLKEFWHVGQEPSAKHQDYPANVWPVEISSFKPVMSALFKRLENCALTLLQACSSYIGEQPDLLPEMAVGGNSILRLIHYPPVAPDQHPKSIRAGAHEDINLITLLIDATASGLEILDRENRWIPVTTPKDCIIVDAGDMLQNISNGFFKSTTHRVVNPNNSRERRYSMPFFVHARGEVALNPLPSCIKATGGLQEFPNITADAYLMQRLKEIGLA